MYLEDSGVMICGNSPSRGFPGWVLFKNVVRWVAEKVGIIECAQSAAATVTQAVKRELTDMASEAITKVTETGTVGELVSNGNDIASNINGATEALGGFMSEVFGNSTVRIAAKAAVGLFCVWVACYSAYKIYCLAKEAFFTPDANSREAVLLAMEESREVIHPEKAVSKPRSVPASEQPPKKPLKLMGTTIPRGGLPGPKYGTPDPMCDGSLLQGRGLFAGGKNVDVLNSALSEPFTAAKAGLLWRNSL